MGLDFGATRQFEKDLKRLSKRYRSLFDDLAPILDSIKKGQCIGTLLTESDIFRAFKVRFANTTINKGKGSGFRLIYAHFEGENYNLAIALSLYCKQDAGFGAPPDRTRSTPDPYGSMESIPGDGLPPAAGRPQDQLQHVGQGLLSDDNLVEATST